ncbi:uncharacterized protein LOC133861897 [Alnus glutinosa]|uniref:uncharacterized protein LOC133861897 n=1 Tax=Alnus glutinosa TaxID=3517 RepID=UPI002D774636|nr:uncharacterized protein LOC133861897 [Alnus glutinosa]
MQQRKSASGRPSGTDGSDFSYRMVVDSRYQKVASGKSRLYALILTQATIQLIGAVFTVLSTSKEGPDRLAISAITAGFVSLIIGELGRRRSRASFLKIYMVASTAMILFWIACVAQSNSMLEVIQDLKKWEAKKLELLEIARILFGLVIQIFAIGTTISLIGNMSPPKRAS